MLNWVADRAEDKWSVKRENKKSPSAFKTLAFMSSVGNDVTQVKGTENWDLIGHANWLPKVNLPDHYTESPSINNKVLMKNLNAV